MKRIVLMLTVAALLVVALTVTAASAAFAKHAQSGPQGTGCTDTYQGNSTNSPKISGTRGGPNSGSSVTC